MMNNIKYWGNPESFAIRHDTSFEKTNYKHIHLMLGEQVIGDVNEMCYFKLWMASIQQFYFRMKFKKNVIDIDFSKYSKIELYELIKKSGQLEKEFSREYSYLPKYDSQKIWARCSFGLDETTDAWELYFVNVGEKNLFYWKGLRSPCPEHLIGKLNYIEVPLIQIETVLEEMITFFGFSVPQRESKIWFQ